MALERNHMDNRQCSNSQCEKTRLSQNLGCLAPVTSPHSRSRHVSAHAWKVEASQGQPTTMPPPPGQSALAWRGSTPSRQRITSETVLNVLLSKGTTRACWYNGRHPSTGNAPSYSGDDVDTRCHNQSGLHYPEAPSHCPQAQQDKPSTGAKTTTQYRQRKVTRCRTWLVHKPLCCW